MRLYSILDKKSGFFSQLMMDHNEATMERSLQENLQGQRVQMAQFPADFDVYCFGEFEPVGGRMTVEQPPIFVKNLREILTNGGQYAEK